MRPGSPGAKLRAEAALAVDAVVTQGRSLDAALLDADARVPLPGRPLLHLLCYGALRSHWRLREHTGFLLDRPLRKRDSVIESLLAIGLYQLTDSRVPDHAAVSLTVEAARFLRRPKHAGLINAVLRNFKRRGLEHCEPGTEEARFNHPAWLIDRVRQDWPDHWQRILEANNARAPMWLRVHRTRMPRDRYLEILRGDAAAESPAAEGAAAATVLPGLDQAICLAEPRPVGELPGFDAGWVSAQDAAAQLAAPWLLADGGRRILDACAAPGGKTGHLLELAGAGAALTALDVDPNRLAAVAENLERLGLTAKLVAADAATPGAWWDGEPYDRILLDAPCSATGVIRRHPDIKLLRRESDLAALARLQRTLLESLWPLLAPAGRLLYVTCSVIEEENERVVGAFLGHHPDARERTVLPDYNIRDLMYRKACGFQVLPGETGMDGFYYACVEKTC